MDWLMGKAKRKDKDSPENGKVYLQDEFVKQRISDVSMDDMVEPPDGTNLNEWLATFTVHFFEHINQIYGALSEFCVSTQCPTASGPNSVQYVWEDELKKKKYKYSAQQYIDGVLQQIQKDIYSEEIFPTKYGNEFPVTFESTARKAFLRLFHVLAHLYHAHFRHLYHLGLVPHLNTLTLHFLTFVKKFSLVKELDFEPLLELYGKLRTQVPVLVQAETKSSFSSSSDSTSETALESPSGTLCAASTSALNSSASASAVVTVSVAKVLAAKKQEEQSTTPEKELVAALHSVKIMAQANGHTKNKSSS